MSGRRSSRVWALVVRLAWQNLRAHRVRSLLSALGMFMGITGTVILSGSLSGVDAAFAALNAHLGPDVFYIEREPFEVDDYSRIRSWPNLTLDEAEHVRKQVKDVRYFVPRYMVPMDPEARERLEVGGKRIVESEVLGTTEEWLRLSRVRILEGRFLSSFDVAAGTATAVIGPELADLLRKKGGVVLGADISLQGYPAKVVGVMGKRSTGMFGYSTRDVVVPLAFFERVFGPRALSLGFAVARPDELKAAQAQASAALRAYRHLLPGMESDFAINAFADAQQIYNRLTGAAYWVIRLLTFLALLVSGGGIMNTLLVAAEERKREVGLLMALGARPNVILAVFLAEAMLLCLVAAALGVLVGGGVIAAIGALSPVEAHLTVGQVAVAVGWAAAAGAVFGFFPALRASRAVPAESLRAAE